MDFRNRNWLFNSKGNKMKAKHNKIKMGSNLLTFKYIAWYYTKQYLQELIWYLTQNEHYAFL